MTVAAAVATPNAEWRPSQGASDMCIKTVKIHTAATRELAAKIAEQLRNEAKPCSDPYNNTDLKGNIWKVSQYVATSYPEL